MWAVMLNFVLFQLAWFACVLGAAHGMPWLGPLAVAAVATVHLIRAPNGWSEFALLLLAATIGTVFDSALVSTGWLAYPSGQWHPMLAPYWIIAMWIGFATTLNVSLNWLKGRSLLAALFGAIGGPLAYFAGAKLGGVTFVNDIPALAALAAGWAIIMPLLVIAGGRLDGWRTGVGCRALASATET